MEQNSKQSIAILGGEGFIGRNLALHLSNRYKCLSVGVVRSPFLDRKDTFISAHPYEEKVNHQCSVIIHLIDNSRCAIEDFLDEEKKLAENIGLNDKDHLVLFSSAVVYANPESEYGLRKKMLEEFYTEYCRKNDVKLTIVRLFNTLGSFQIPQRPGSLVANIIYNHMVGRASEINDRQSKRDFIYASDIPKFIEYFLENGVTGTLDLGSGKLTSIADIISILESEVLKIPLNIIDKNKTDSIISPRANNQYLSQIPVTDIVTAMSQMVDFYKNNIDTIKKYV